MLDAHSAIAIAPETHFIRRFWLKRDDFGDLADDRDHQTLIDEMTAMPEFAEMELDCEAFREAARGAPREYPALLRLLLTMFGQARQATVVGEKTPNHLLYMPTLQALFPGARFIHIVRDPRAVVNSWRHVPWSTGWIAGDAMVWRRYMATARRSPPAGTDSLLTIHYEDLARDPEQTLQTVCRFIGVPYEAGVCDFHEETLRGVNISREPWKANVARPVDPSRMEKWREELTTVMIHDIEAVAWREMRRLGYRPDGARLRLFFGSLPLWGRQATRSVQRKLKRSTQ
jgi:hypothetical protein